MASFSAMAQPVLSLSLSLDLSPHLLLLHVRSEGSEAGTRDGSLPFPSRPSARLASSEAATAAETTATLARLAQIPTLTVIAAAATPTPERTVCCLPYMASFPRILCWPGHAHIPCILRSCPFNEASIRMANMSSLLRSCMFAAMSVCRLRMIVQRGKRRGGEISLVRSLTAFQPATDSTSHDTHA